jgi:hypothetical protein
VTVALLDEPLHVRRSSLFNGSTGQQEEWCALRLSPFLLSFCISVSTTSSPLFVMSNDLTPTGPTSLLSLPLFKHLRPLLYLFGGLRT